MLQRLATRGLEPDREPEGGHRGELPVADRAADGLGVEPWAVLPVGTGALGVDVHPLEHRLGAGLDARGAAVGVGVHARQGEAPHVALRVARVAHARVPVGPEDAGGKRGLDQLGRLVGVPRVAHRHDAVVGAAVLIAPLVVLAREGLAQNVARHVLVVVLHVERRRVEVGEVVDIDHLDHALVAPLPQPGMPHHGRLERVVAGIGQVEGVGLDHLEIHLVGALGVAQQDPGVASPEPVRHRLARGRHLGRGHRAAARGGVPLDRGRRATVAHQDGQLLRQPIHQRRGRFVGAVDPLHVGAQSVPGHVERPEHEGALTEFSDGPCSHVLPVGAIEDADGQGHLLLGGAGAPSVAGAEQHRTPSGARPRPWAPQYNVARRCRA